MRLLIVGPLSGYISAAGKIALARGAEVAQVDDIDRGMAALRAGQGADLVMIDVKLDVGRMIQALKTERFHIPSSPAASATTLACSSARLGPPTHVMIWPKAPTARNAAATGTSQSMWNRFPATLQTPGRFRP